MCQPSDRHTVAGREHNVRVRLMTAAIIASGIVATALFVTLGEASAKTKIEGKSDAVLLTQRTAQSAKFWRNWPPNSVSSTHQRQVWTARLEAPIRGRCNKCWRAFLMVATTWSVMGVTKSNLRSSAGRLPLLVSRARRRSPAFRRQTPL